MSNWACMTSTTHQGAIRKLKVRYCPLAFVCLFPCLKDWNGQWPPYPPCTLVVPRILVMQFTLTCLQVIHLATTGTVSEMVFLRLGSLTWQQKNISSLRLAVVSQSPVPGQPVPSTTWSLVKSAKWLAPVVIATYSIVNKSRKHRRRAQSNRA
jgi:hypothetical protein